MDFIIEREVLQACEYLFGANYYVAVRSSAAAEDGSNASFAGQHESHLFVSAVDLILRIRESIASAWSFGALSYRLAQGIPITDIKYAIVVQRMVDAKKSGIGFSMETAAAKLFEPWYVTLVNDFLAFKFFGWLQDLVSKFKLSGTTRCYLSSFLKTNYQQA